MAFSKVVEARIFGVTLVNSTQRKVLGDYSGATMATATVVSNPLRGTLLWDDCMYVVTGASVNGGATGGSYTIQIQTDAVMGYTGLPIAEITLGPNSTTAGKVMDNLHHSKGSPIPTHVQVVQGNTGLATFHISAIAKQYRGVLGTAGGKNSERVLQGSFLGGPGAANVTADTTYILGSTDTDIGMGRIRLWDSFFAWAIAGSTITGTWDVDLVTKLTGKTVSIATTSTTGAGVVATIGDKKPLVNVVYGQCPNPTQVILTEVTAGGIADLDVVGLAKTGRGTMSKR